MHGYIVNFYKYASFPSDLKQTMANSLPKDQDEYSLLVYGDYDRLNVKKVDNFTRFRDVDNYAQSWLGPRQTILLYQLDRNEKSDVLSQIFFPKTISPTDDKAKKFHSFTVFTMVTLDPLLHNCKDYSEVITFCKKTIDNIVSPISVKKGFDYEVYGSFSSSELVIVWWIDQYVDALRLTDHMRYISFVDERNSKVIPFISFYSIIAQSRNIPQCEYDKEKKIRGYAELKLIFQSGVDSDRIRSEFIKKIKDTLIDLSIPKNEIVENHEVGEYDYSISMPADCLCSPFKNIFQSKGVLHWRDEDVQKNILSTHIRLYYSDSDDDGESLDISNKEYRYEPSRELPQRNDSSLLYADIQLIREMIYSGNSESSINWDNRIDLFHNYRQCGLRQVIKHCIPETDGLCDTLDLLYSDYVNNCSNSISAAWASDLNMQFIEMIDYIADQLDKGCSMNCCREFGEVESKRTIDKMTMFRDIKSISSVFIQMIYHIAQSRRTVFVVPSCHIRYMGQYDMILHAYYGLEKYLLRFAYTIKQNDCQPYLVPIFSIDVIPEIGISMYKVTNHYDANQKVSGIFNINMPLGAMTDFLRYSMVISHETAHFISPCNRNKRNQVIGMLFFSEFVVMCAMRKVILKFNDDVTLDENNNRRFEYLLNRMIRDLIPIVYNNMREFYLIEIHRSIENHCKHNLAYGEIFPRWDEYCSYLIDEINRLLNNTNKMGEIYDFLFENREAFEQKTNDLIESLNHRHKSGALFSEKYISDILGSLRSAVEVPENVQVINGVIRDIDDILDFSDNPFPASYLLSNAYREACQDLFMIRTFNIGLVDYLVFLDRHKNDILMLGGKLPRSERIRIAMVCDYLLVHEDCDLRGAKIVSADTLVSRFKGAFQEYYELFKNIPEMRISMDEQKSIYKTTEINKKIRGLYQRLECAFQENFRAYREYITEYSEYRYLFLAQMEDSDISFLELQPEWKKYIGKLGEFYRNWKEAVKLKDVELMNEGIFYNNIQMIQYFQRQDTIKSLKEYLKARDEDATRT